MLKDKKALIHKMIIALFCILINFLGRRIGEALYLPVWLDSVGTCICAYFGGLIPALITAIVSQAITLFYNPIPFLYVITAVVIALAVSYSAKRKYLDNISKMLITSFWIGVLCVVFSTPLNIIFYNGYSGNIWGDALIDMLNWYNISGPIAAIAGEILVEIVDKQVCILIAFLAIKVVLLINNKRHYGYKSLIIIMLLSSLNVIFGIETKANNDNYLGTIYNNTSGMMSSEANVIAQTSDGYIWIGSYAGLTRYNGTEFEFIRDGGIVNVTAIYPDSLGRLWIGTNDGGIARYENDTFTFFTTADGLSANSIRVFTEDDNGNVYVGTTGCICKFDSFDSISYVCENIRYVTSLEAYNGLLAGIDNNGNLFVISNDELIKQYYSSDVFAICMDETSRGVLVGTTENYLYRLSDDGMLLDKTSFESLNDVCDIEEDKLGRIWLCAESGFGNVLEDGSFNNLTLKDFDA